jgi:NAD(P)-dependent dehydrogenase (short-subunit alcohol dehydrogenase family)
MVAPVALVTGASRGIGRAIALKLASDGADIVAVARAGGAVSSLGAAVRSIGVDCLPIGADLTDPAQASAVVQSAWEWRRDGVNILVNAAGMLIRKPEGEVTAEEWDLTFALNVRAPFLLIKEIGPLMYESGNGAIVSVASIAGERVTGAPAPYQASKAALIQLTRYFANRLAPRVRVNAVGPGYVRTDLSRDWLAVPENAAWVESRTPLGRIATPEDVAGPVAFLASNEAAYITGQHLLVDGGWSIG